MNEDELARLRDRVRHDQTACRCGHLLAACADCCAWLVEHSPRIVAGWRWYCLHYAGTPYLPAGIRSTDLAEADDLAFFEDFREGYRRINL